VQPRLLVLSLLLLVGCPATDFVLEFEGVVLTIPDGALPAGTSLGDLNVTVEAGLPVPLPDNRTLLSSVYAFTPHGIQFDAPIGVGLPYTEAFDGEPSVFRLGDDMDDGWAPVAGASFDGEVASFTTSTFSWYAVTELPAGGDDDDDDGETLNGDVGFDSEAAMVAFCDQYDSVTGTVTIAGPNIDGTDALSCLRVVGGALLVQNSGAESVTLEVLEAVGGALVITLNTVLDRVSMPFLATVGGDLLLESNGLMSSLTLPDLVSIGGGFSAAAQAAILTVDLGALVEVVDGFELSGPTGMSALNLGALTTVGGDLELAGHTQLTGLDLRALVTVGGGVNISDEAQLVLIQAGRLATIGGDLIVEDNGTLSTVTLPDLEEVEGELRLLDLGSVGTIDLNELRTVGARLTVQGTDATALALDSLLSAGELRVASNPLASVTAPLLTEVDGELLISTGANLDTLSLPALETAGLLFLHGTSLPAIALPALTTTTGDFHVAEHDDLSSLSAPLLATVGGNLEIEQNPNLPTSQADALAAQADVAGTTTIAGNGSGR